MRAGSESHAGIDGQGDSLFFRGDLPGRVYGDLPHPEKIQGISRFPVLMAQDGFRTEGGQKTPEEVLLVLFEKEKGIGGFFPNP